MKITQCNWEITTNCNLSCKHCLINHLPSKELSTQECFDAIDSLLSMGCKQINFTGGEPFFRKDFLEILKYSKKKGMTNTIFTNGTLLASSLLKEIKKDVAYFAISLEGCSKHNDLIRGNSSFDKTLHTLDLLKEEKIPFGVHLTLTSKNHQFLKEILIFFKSLNPFNISINELVLRGRALENQDELFTVIRSKDILKKISEVFPNEKFVKETGCIANKSSVFMTSEGALYICTELRQTNPKEKIGNILEIESIKIPNKFSKLSNLCNCPYYVYHSKKISVNLLTNDSCVALNKKIKSKDLFPGIGKICKGCKTCCRTYGWLTEEESKRFNEEGISLVKINNKITCIDSFDKNIDGKRILEKIPRCKFYNKERCKIHKKKPLDCQLFPLKTKFKEGKVIIGLSKGCKYVSLLDDLEINILCERILEYINQNIDKELKIYLDLMKEVNNISLPKNFWMKEIAQLSNNEGKWFVEKILI